MLRANCNNGINYSSGGDMIYDMRNEKMIKIEEV